MLIAPLLVFAIAFMRLPCGLLHSGVCWGMAAGLTAMYVMARLEMDEWHRTRSRLQAAADEMNVRNGLDAGVDLSRWHPPAPSVSLGTDIRPEDR
jgi:hypothetical protein